jgi:hypothetical protein
MRQKNETKVNSAEELDIDKLILEGEMKHKALKEEAANQVELMKADNSFDFNIESIDMFKFQEKDFREEKKKVQQLLLEHQAEQAKKMGTIAQGRNKRQAAMNALEEVHSYKLRPDRPKQDKNDKDGDYIAPKKDRSI